MAFIISGSGKRTAFAYEGSTMNAAKLVIEYKAESVTVDIEDEDKEDDPVNSLFKCYPNPAHDFFNVELQDQLKGGSIEILDVTGKIVQPSITHLNKNRMVVKTKDLVPGIYFITVRTNEYTATQRLLIK